MSRSDYEKEWGKQYEKPGPLDKTFSLFFRVFRKSTFSALSFKVPTPETERMFLKSFDETLTRYRGFCTTRE